MAGIIPLARQHARVEMKQEHSKTLLRVLFRTDVFVSAMAFSAEHTKLECKITCKCFMIYSESLHQEGSKIR